MPPVHDRGDQRLSRVFHALLVGDELHATGQVGVLGRGDRGIAVEHQLEGLGGRGIHPPGAGRGHHEQRLAVLRARPLQLLDYAFRPGFIRILCTVFQAGVHTDGFLAGPAGQIFQLVLVQPQADEPSAEGPQVLPLVGRLRATGALRHLGLLQILPDLLVPDRKHPFGGADNRAGDDGIHQEKQGHADGQPGEQRAGNPTQTAPHGAIFQGLDQPQQTLAHQHDQRPQSDADGQHQQELRRRISLRVHQMCQLSLPAHGEGNPHK